ncbi:MAG: hypothetical protein U9Q23_01980 [Candidatus Bipolaricaulota bacterium]|nr:hypothetical protein [Candidatus Bipolaricaulota bacterium]
MNTATDMFSSEEMITRYRQAIERALSRLPVKNGVIDIDAVWVETSIPFHLLREIISTGDIKLPTNVDRINMSPQIGMTGWKGGNNG